MHFFALGKFEITPCGTFLGVTNLSPQEVTVNAWAADPGI